MIINRTTNGIFLAWFKTYNDCRHPFYCCPIKIGTILYPAQIHQITSILQKESCLLALCEIDSTKHKKPLENIYTSQIHVIWDKKRLVSIMLKFYWTEIFSFIAG